MTNQDRKKVNKAALVGLLVSFIPLVLATVVMALIDNDAGPKYPYDMIHGGLTGLCFVACAFVSSKLTYRYCRPSPS